MENRFTGSMLGLALGDAMGASYEGGIVEGLVWRGLKAIRGQSLMWTDDTQMAMGLAESLVARGELDQDHLAKVWAHGMQPMRGYGGGARKLLNRIVHGMDWREANTSVFQDGSYGNGAAMRAAPIGLYFHGKEELGGAAVKAAEITHAHPLGIEGGVLIARAVDLALGGKEEILETLLDESNEPEYQKRLRLAAEWVGKNPSRKQIRNRLGCSIKAHESSVTAVYAFCQYPDNFETMMKFIIELGGDTDTIGAMAGGIFGARNGIEALPEEALSKLEARDEIERTAVELFKYR